jgi:hypothetical protein
LALKSVAGMWLGEGSSGGWIFKGQMKRIRDDFPPL